ncbi:MAG: flagellar hook-basal body complex protein FliE [Pseudomonadota bacterium]
MITPLSGIALPTLGNNDGTFPTNLSNTPGAAPGSGTSKLTESFAEAMVAAMASVSNDLKSAEAASISGMRGQAPIHEVVQKVMSAEQSLQAALAVREKVVSAYLEVSRMTI